MTKRSPVILALVGLVLLGGVAALLLRGGATADEVPPLPELADVEPAVAEKVRATRDAVVRDRDHASWRRFARTLQAHGMLDEALDAYDVAARIAPDDAARFDDAYLAALTRTGSEPDEAVRRLEAISSLRPRYQALHLRLGLLHEGLGDADAAAACFRRAEDLGPAAHARLGLGRLALAAGRVDEAIATLESARDLDPDLDAIHAALARAYGAAGRPSDARLESARTEALGETIGFEDPVEFAMLEESVSYVGCLRLADGWLRVGQPARALEWVDRGLAVRPNGLDAVERKARVLSRLARPDEAIELFNDVLAVRAEDVGTLCALAACYFEKGERVKALGLLQRAHAIDPTHVATRHNLAILLQTYRPEEALDHLRQVLRAEPRRHSARVLLAAILAHRERMTEALDQLRLVLAVDPEHRAALDLLEQLQSR